MQTRIWQHRITGEQYAVAVDSYGMIFGACGPLHHREVAAARAGDWNSDSEALADIRGRHIDFADVTEGDH